MSLQPGDKAPDFSTHDEAGNPLSLKDFAGKKLLLYFYPKDDTSGCTAQACALRDAMPDFAGLNTAVLGVSRDSQQSHVKFKHKYDLNFPLLVDSDGHITEAYGVWVEKSMYGKKYMGIERSSFLINEQGNIQALWRKVKVPGHAEAVLAALRSA